MSKTIDIMQIKGKVEIRGQQIEVYPLPIQALIPMYKKIKTNVAEGELTAGMIEAFDSNVHLCCNLTEGQVKNLTGSERMTIIEKAIKLDPDVLKKSLAVIGKLKV